MTFPTNDATCNRSNIDRSNPHLIRLYREGKSQREIAELVGMTQRGVGLRLKKILGDEYKSHPEKAAHRPRNKFMPLR